MQILIILIDGGLKIFAQNICPVIRKFLYLQLIITTLLLATSLLKTVDSRRRHFNT